jgi:hypothetical protein
MFFGIGSWLGFISGVFAYFFIDNTNGNKKFFRFSKKKLWDEYRINNNIENFYQINISNFNPRMSMMSRYSNHIINPNFYQVIGVTPTKQLILKKPITFKQWREQKEPTNNINYGDFVDFDINVTEYLLQELQRMAPPFNINNFQETYIHRIEGPPSIRSNNERI